MILDFDDFDIRDRFYSIEEKIVRLKMKMETLNIAEKKSFNDFCAQAYIFHDSALEGMVVSSDEIASVFNSDTEAQYVRSRVLQEIRNQKRKLNEIIDLAIKSKHASAIYRSEEISYENIIKLHDDLYYGIPKKAAGKVRSSPPLHLSYFHDLVKPKLVKESLVELCNKTSDPEFRAQHPINQAAIFHYNFMQIYPFIEGSGRVGRLIMNSFLLQGGFELAIIHASERQQYYETLRDGIESVRMLIIESIESTLDSRINLLEESDMLVSVHRGIFRKKQNYIPLSY